MAKETKCSTVIVPWKMAWPLILMMPTITMPLMNSITGPLIEVARR